MDTLWHDVRCGARALAKAPGFTAVAVLTLGLGIGANTAIFSVTRAVILKPQPYPEPDRVVVVHNVQRGRPLGPHSSSWPDFEDWREQKNVFERTALSAYWTFNLTGREGPERIVGARVTGEFFATLGVPGLFGRTLSPDDDRPQTPEAVVLSYSLWQRSFAADRGVLGEVLPFEGRPHTVVGVMPPDFRFPEEDIQIWAALKDNMNGMQRHNRFMYVFGRLAAGVTLAQAQSAMDVLSARFEAEHPESNKGYSVRVVSAHETRVGRVRPALLVLLGAVGFVLLTACANVGSLLLGRAVARARESAIRAALGAGRMRLLRQFLVENVLLALAGGAAGVAIGYLALPVIVHLHPGGIPRMDEVRLDALVLFVTLAVSIVTGLALGLIPGAQAWRTNLAGSLKEGGRNASGGASGARLRDVLVATEVALALVLLTGGGLLLRSFRNIIAVEPGFVSDRVLLLSAFLTPPGYRTTLERLDYVKRALENLETLPGVESAAAVTDPPLGESGLTLSFHEAGNPRTTADSPQAYFRATSDEYFRTLKIPLVRGRTFEPSDDRGSRVVVVINEALARQIWPNDDPLGKRIRWSDPMRDVGPIEVVGVVKDVKHRGRDANEGGVAYGSIRQVTFPWLRGFTFTVRTAGDPAPRTDSIRHAILRADPTKPLYDVRTVAEALDASVAERRFHLFVLQLFAVLALTLAAVGIYGVVSYSVAERTREVGLRMALGAEGTHVFRLVMRRGLRSTLTGLAVGIAAALGLTRFLASMLFAVEPTDPGTLAAVVAVLFAVAVGACAFPARRAVRIDPILALHEE